MLYSVKQLADYTGISRQRVNTLIKNGRLSRVNGFLDSEDPLNRSWISIQKSSPVGHKPIGQSKHRTYQPAEGAEETSELDGQDMGDLLRNLTSEGLGRLKKADIDKLKSLETMLKTQTDRQLKRRELIERSLVASVFGELYTIDANSWKTLGSKTAAAVAGICECDDPEKVLQVEQHISAEVTLILQHVKQVLDAALKGWEPK
jgi:hypothetical protein